MEAFSWVAVAAISGGLMVFGLSERGREHTKGVALALGIIGLLLMTIGGSALGAAAVFLGFILVGVTFLFGALA